MDQLLPSWWAVAIIAILLGYSAIRSYHDLRIKLELPTALADIDIVRNKSIFRFVEVAGILQLQAFIHLYIENQKDESLILSNARLYMRGLFRPWKKLDIPFISFFEVGKVAKQQKGQLQIGSLEEKRGYLIFRLSAQRFIHIPNCITAKLYIRFRGHRPLMRKMESFFLLDTRKMDKEMVRETDPILKEIEKARADMNTLSVDIRPLSGLNPRVVEIEDADINGRLFVVPNISIVNRTGRNISCIAELVVKGTEYHEAKLQDIRIEAEQWKEKYGSNYGERILNSPIDIDPSRSISGCLVFHISRYEIEQDVMLFGWADQRKKPHYLRLTDMHNDEVKELKLFYNIRMSINLNDPQEDTNS